MFSCNQLKSNHWFHTQTSNAHKMFDIHSSRSTDINMSLIPTLCSRYNHLVWLGYPSLQVFFTQSHKADTVPCGGQFHTYQILRLIHSKICKQFLQYGRHHSHVNVELKNKTIRETMTQALYCRRIFTPSNKLDCKSILTAGTTLIPFWWTFDLGQGCHEGQVMLLYGSTKFRSYWLLCTRHIKYMCTLSYRINF